MNSLPFYPLVWKTASGTFRGSLTWDMTLSFTLTLIVAIGFVLLLVLQWCDLRQRVRAVAGQLDLQAHAQPRARPERDRRDHRHDDRSSAAG